MKGREIGYFQEGLKGQQTPFLWLCMKRWRIFTTWDLRSPCTAFSQSLSVNSFQWRIRDERAGNTFSHGSRDLKRLDREEKWGLGTRQDMRPKYTISTPKQSLIFEHHKGRILFYLFFFLHWHLTYSATLSFIKFYCQRNLYYLFVFSMIKPIITKTINS